MNITNDLEKSLKSFNPCEDAEFEVLSSKIHGKKERNKFLLVPIFFEKVDEITLNQIGILFKDENGLYLNVENHSSLLIKPS